MWHRGAKDFMVKDKVSPGETWGIRGWGGSRISGWALPSELFQASGSSLTHWKTRKLQRCTCRRSPAKPFDVSVLLLRGLQTDWGTFGCGAKNNKQGGSCVHEEAGSVQESKMADEESKRVYQRTSSGVTGEGPSLNEWTWVEATEGWRPTRNHAVSLKGTGDKWTFPKETAASLHTDQFKDIKLLRSLNGERLQKFLRVFLLCF